ncbi:MAG: tetratricopeptide repeat protein [Nitrospirae bacterium]|nr:tetratricopeptide repeat protein [Nitrospirota bacterium]
MGKQQSALNHLDQSNRLVEEGNFNDAVRENQEVLSMFDKRRPADQALFNIGLIYSHYGNPEKDFLKSVSYFEQLINEFPQSPLKEQSKIWVGILKVIEKQKVKVDEYAATNINLLRGQKLLSDGDYSGALRENLVVLDLPGKSPFKDEALFNSALIYAHHDNPQKDYHKSMNYFSQLIKDYPGSPLLQQAKIWFTVLNILEKTKQMDIEIEKKNRELKR